MGFCEKIRVLEKLVLSLEKVSHTKPGGPAVCGSFLSTDGYSAKNITGAHLLCLLFFPWIPKEEF